jgi:hypothetical protein
VAASALKRGGPTRIASAPIRPVAGAPIPLAPVNGVTILSLRPSFIWYNTTNGAPFTVQLQRAGSRDIKRFVVGSDTSWTLPESEQPLLPGTVYSWAVLPSGAGRVADPVQFKTVTGQQFVEISSRIEAIEALGISPASTWLLKARVYLDEGLAYEAQVALDQAVAAAGNTPIDIEDLSALIHNLTRR